jgi:hypothetical protein
MTNIKDPILLSDAQEKYGVGRKWIQARMKRGEIRFERAGKYVLVEESDVKRLAPRMDLVEKALAKRKRKK